MTNARNGRSSDLSFEWIVKTYGEEWRGWQVFMSKWIVESPSGTEGKVKSLIAFIDKYLTVCVSYASNIPLLFSGFDEHKCSSEELNATLAKSITSESARSLRINHIVEFIDWIIEESFTDTTDKSKSILFYSNPFKVWHSKGAYTETVKSPLPYKYIKDLRKILCPNPETGNFKDWLWAQHQTGNSHRSAHWVEVTPAMIDEDDSDCVWRIKQVKRNKKAISVYQIWSPVAAMTLFIQLHLPLRNYQIRLLDSGEADTFHYNKGSWSKNNKTGFTFGNDSRPYSKGVFKRIFDTELGTYSTGLYISTNKTADQNKDDFQKGYTIPWQHDVVIYWLEKLRNWQIKYNPIDEPTCCSTLKRKHFGGLKSPQALAAMGKFCFLFRDPTAKKEDRNKPIPYNNTLNLWYRLLRQLETQLSSNDSSKTISPKLVTEYPENHPESNKYKTLFPMHCLRVSLITCYALEGNVPIPIISKLLVGHSRLIMTIYYTKVSPSAMATMMSESEENIEQREQQSLTEFLATAKLCNIQERTVYKDGDSLSASMMNRNPIGWELRQYGICLVGGNTVRTQEVETLGGCWNGGDLIKDSSIARHRTYAAVPHGPGNCVRCRWFITDARYLHSLNAHHNYVSYRATQAANKAAELESQLDKIKDELYLSQENDSPFIKHAELVELERRYERQILEADEFAKDLIATFSLIVRIMHIENKRREADSNNKLIAVGDESDVNIALKYIDTDSELFQLSLLCEDAEIYPDMADELLKTSVVEKRSRKLNRILMNRGYTPYFLFMDEKQQLIATNAFMRELAKHSENQSLVEGFKSVSDYLEAQEHLLDNKLIENSIATMAQEFEQQYIKLNDNRKALR